ncbi:hypothetical protein [Streptomyces echinatus]|uniref:Uncharacterized protein n=1 Tax=Streptomyces echinatus TaxID=67293 RepID=A0A7W9Q4A5_9ACTN|nr:hypothetical protein [Streptomyces echinatus]MBB5932532.1 hypothetical protein [Streptomyces echinatus]
MNNSGGDCIPDGEEPPAGWARYPQAMVPQHVGDKWDRYWSTRTLDEHGGRPVRRDGPCGGAAHAVTGPWPAGVGPATLR